MHGNEIIRTIKELQYLCSTKNYMMNDYTQKPKKRKPPEGYNEMINEFKSSSLVKSSFLLNRYR